ncbi:hypothetical protein [Iamia sp.]|uniref:hypothetical protein n=1 Tax=Iamia sp. TaxID=2722710 RepID=UPI002C0F62E9|nr:hypothetical protein [Iamia sp.]HXH58407.1 hypothetical protein [Iamia sp.]
MADRHKHAALAGIAGRTATIATAEADREREIARALHHGAPWSEIAGALGVTAQSAHRRFRWLRYDPVTRRSWQERPLPLR